MYKLYKNFITIKVAQLKNKNFNKDKQIKSVFKNVFLNLNDYTTRRASFLTLEIFIKLHVVFIFMTFKKELNFIYFIFHRVIKKWFTSFFSLFQKSN